MCERENNLLIKMP